MHSGAAPLRISPTMRRGGDAQEQGPAQNRGHATRESRPHPATATAAGKNERESGGNSHRGKDAARPHSGTKTADSSLSADPATGVDGARNRRSRSGSTEHGDDGNSMRKSHPLLAPAGHCRKTTPPTKDGRRERPSFRSIPASLLQAPLAASGRSSACGNVAVSQENCAAMRDNRDSRRFDREGEKRAKMSHALVTLMSKLEDPTNLRAVQTMMQRWMAQRCARSIHFAFVHWCQGAACLSFQRRCRRSAYGRVWSEWRNSTQQSVAQCALCAQILRRDVADCFMAWRSQTERFKAESSLIADIKDAEQILSRKVLCLEQVLSKDVPGMVCEKLAAGDFYKAQAASLRQQKLALEYELLQLQGQLEREKTRSDWLAKQVQAMAVLAATVVPQTGKHGAEEGRPGGQPAEGGKDGNKKPIPVEGDCEGGGAALVISCSPAPQRQVLPAKVGTPLNPRTLQLGDDTEQPAVLHKSSSEQMRDITLVRCANGKLGVHFVESFHADVRKKQDGHGQVQGVACPRGHKLRLSSTLIGSKCGLCGRQEGWKQGFRCAQCDQDVCTDCRPPTVSSHVCYVITHLVPHGPAILSGKLQKGDYVWRIDDTWTSALSREELTDMLRGAPGSSVVVTTSSPAPRAYDKASSPPASSAGGTSPSTLHGGRAGSDAKVNTERRSPMHATSPDLSIMDVLIKRGDSGGLGIR